MGVNRQFRRQEQRQKMREWVRDGTAERVRKLSANGITPDDFEKVRKDSYQEGFMYASELFLKTRYAAIAKELIQAGNDREEVVSFVKGVDHRFATMYDADEEINDVYDEIGVRFNVDRNAIERIEVTRA